MDKEEDPPFDDIKEIMYTEELEQEISIKHQPILDFVGEKLRLNLRPELICLSVPDISHSHSQRLCDDLTR